MKIENLDYYVKFVFNLVGQDEGFVTSDIKALKEVVNASEFKIGDTMDVGGKFCKVENIYIKHVNEDSRSNKYGFNLQETSMSGDLKDSLITIYIDFIEQI